MACKLLYHLHAPTIVALMCFLAAGQAKGQQVKLKRGNRQEVSGPSLTPQCPEGLVYRRCPRSCPRTCDHVTGNATCKARSARSGEGGCEPGCYCPGAKVVFTLKTGAQLCIHRKKCGLATLERKVRIRAEQRKKVKLARKAAAKMAKKMKKAAAKTACQKRRLAEIKACMMTDKSRRVCHHMVVQCSKRGDLLARQCVNTMCHCVSESGEKLTGSEHSKKNKSVDCLGLRAGVTCAKGKRYLACQLKCPHSCPQLNMTCADPDKANCEPGCYCPSGFLLDSDGECVRQRACGKAAFRRARKARLEKVKKAKKAAETPCRLQRASELKSCRQPNASRLARNACRQNATKCDRKGGFAAKQCYSNRQCVCVNEEGVALEGTSHSNRGKNRKFVDCLAVRAGVICAKGERYLACQPKCPRSCPQLNMTCANPDKANCVPGCYCPPGFLLDSDGECVRRRACGKAAFRHAKKARLEKLRAAKSPCRLQRASELKSCRQASASRLAQNACRQNATKCDRKGGFAAKQCYSNGQCVCVNEEGAALEGTSHSNRGKNRKFVDCLAARAGVSCPRGQRYHSCQPKSCPRTCAHIRDENCTVISKDASCVPGCYCPKGRVLDGDVCVKASRKHCKVLTPCQRQRRSKLRACALLPGEPCNATVCNRDGSFAVKQCYRLTKLCHCVTTEGELIVGSTHALKDRRKVNCENMRSF